MHGSLEKKERERNSKVIRDGRLKATVGAISSPLAVLAVRLASQLVLVSFFPLFFFSPSPPPIPRPVKMINASEAQ